jgi:transcription elongation GreA/GreB family factor
VHATDLETNEAERFIILGAWDSDPDKGVVSYLTPMAQSLLNRKISEEVEFEIHGARHRHRIERITPYKWTFGDAVPAPAPAKPANDGSRLQAG